MIGKWVLPLPYIFANDYFTLTRRSISRVYENSWKTAYKGIIPDDYLNSIPEGQWAAKLDQAKWHTMVCIENGCIIGTSRQRRYHVC